MNFAEFMVMSPHVPLGIERPQGLRKIWERRGKLPRQKTPVAFQASLPLRPFKPDDFFPFLPHILLKTRSGGEDMQGKRLAANTALTTLAALFTQALGLWFQSMLAKRMGAAGLGLMGLITSVGSLAATFAISGIRFASTRLVAEEMGLGRMGRIPPLIRRCLLYALLCGGLAGGALRLCADSVAAHLLGDVRAALALKILSLGMPFLSAGAVLGGYFTGTCRAGMALGGPLSEETVRVAVTFLILSLTGSTDPRLTCAAAAAGSASGELASFLVMAILYLADKKRPRPDRPSPPGQLRRIVTVAVPLAFTAYARVAVKTLQQLLIPLGLTKSGATAEKALAGYGTVRGMAMPVITFPMVLFSSVSELIVPELTEEQMRGNLEGIRHWARALLRFTMGLSTAAALFVLCFSKKLGAVLFSSAPAGKYIALLAPLMPVMYLDNVTDGMLRGLGEHMYTMGLNLVDSLVSTTAMWFILPRFALDGYIAILYLSEIFNFILSIKRLTDVTGERLPARANM